MCSFLNKKPHIYFDCAFIILTISFCLAISLLHLEQISVLSGKYEGKKTWTLGSGLSGFKNIFSTSSVFQRPHCLHFILSFVFIVPNVVFQ